MTKIKVPARQLAAWQITSDVSGRVWTFSDELKQALELKIKQYDLPFVLRPTAGARLSLVYAGGGVPLNVEQRRNYESHAIEVRKARQRLDALTRGMGEKPRFQVMAPEIFEAFKQDVIGWDSVCESVEGGKELSIVPSRLQTLPEAYLGIRFWPVVFSKIAGGRRHWVLVPPTAFGLEPTRIISISEGHPHVYQNTNEICPGNAEFDYRNPLQTALKLREWYVGYDPDSVTYASWIQVARMWWKANADMFFETFAEPKVIVAPYSRQRASAVLPLTRAMVEQFLEGIGNNWTRDGGRPPERDAEELDDESPLGPEFERGLHGAGYFYTPELVRLKFGTMSDGWDTKCKVCKEILDRHWGLACPRDVPFHDGDLGSRFDFTHWDKGLPAEHSGRDALNAEGKTFGLADIVRRSKDVASRSHWLHDALRKFGPTVSGDSACIDCGQPYVGGGHDGPDCKARKAERRD